MRKPVHLVGSVAMDTCEEVFERLSETVGPHISRLPDGETGKRSRWIAFQREILMEHPGIEVDPTVPELEIHEWNGRLLRAMPLLRFKDGTDLESIRFETGYDTAALDSHGVFGTMRGNGRMPEGVPFQVCLPTPMSAAYMYISYKAHQDFINVYERSLRTALGRILDGIPHEDLAIQYDVCQEVLMFENYFPYRPEDYKEQVFDLLGRLGNAVPEDVQLGYHLCYGSPADEHLVMPGDTEILVEMMNGIGAAVTRKIEFLHIPVPRDRTDDAYFRPLHDLKIDRDIELYLGLIHHDDEAGDAARIAAARKYVDELGISTECGWGRTDPARVPGLLESHRKQARLISD